MNKEVKNLLKRKKILYNRVIIVIIIIALIMFFIISSKFLSITQRENMEYSDIDNNSNIAGKVLKVYEDKGFTFVMTTDSLKIWFPHSRNYDYNYPYLNGFLIIGDSIRKEPNNDTLTVYRKSNQYYFVLGRYVNQTK